MADPVKVMLVTLCSPLRKLILKDSHYSPGDPEHAAFNAIKAEFKKKIILPYFDRDKETILQTDASKKGFGAVILQEEQPIYYALRALTSAEKNYQNVRLKQLFGAWRNSTIFSMVESLFYRLTRKTFSFYFQKAYD